MGAFRRNIQSDSTYVAVKVALATAAAVYAAHPIIDKVFEIQQRTTDYNWSFATSIFLAGALTLGYGFDRIFLKQYREIKKEKKYCELMRKEGFDSLKGSVSSEHLESLSDEYVNRLVKIGTDMGYSEKEALQIIGTDSPSYRGELREMYLEQKKKASRETLDACGKLQDRSREMRIGGNEEALRLAEVRMALDVAENKASRSEVYGLIGNEKNKPVILNIELGNGNLIEKRGILRKVQKENGVMTYYLDVDGGNKNIERVEGLRRNDRMRVAEVEYRKCRVNAAKVIGNARKLEPIINTVAHQMFLTRNSTIDGAKKEYERYKAAKKTLEASASAKREGEVQAKPAEAVKQPQKVSVNQDVKLLRRTVVERAKPDSWVEGLGKRISTAPVYNEKTQRYEYEMSWPKRIFLRETHDLLTMGVLGWINSRDMNSEVLVWLDSRPWYLKPLPLKLIYNTAHLAIRIPTTLIGGVPTLVADVFWTDKIKRFRDYTGMKAGKIKPKGKWAEEVPTYLGSVHGNLARNAATGTAKWAWNHVAKHFTSNMAKMAGAYVVISGVDWCLSAAGMPYTIRDGLYFASGAFAYHYKPIERLRKARTNKDRQAKKD